MNHGTAHVPSWPSTWVVFQMPSAYAPLPPMSVDAVAQVGEAAERGEERHLRRAGLRDVRAFARDRGVADAVELDVPADLLHVDLHARLGREGLDHLLQVLLRLGRVGHRPERQRRALLERALRRRRRRPSWLNCCRRRRRHRRRARSGASTSAVTAATSASLLGTGTPPLSRCYKNVFGDGRKETPGVCGGARPPRRAGRWSRGRPARRRAFAAGGDRRSPATRATSASPAAKPRPSLSWRIVVSGRIDVWGELDVVEADDRKVLGHAQADLGRGADRADRHQVGGGEDRGRAARAARAGARSASRPLSA